MYCRLCTGFPVITCVRFVIYFVEHLDHSHPPLSKRAIWVLDTPFVLTLAVEGWA